MSRSLTRAQALQNRAFLKVLRRTANVRLACREVGLKYGTVQHRRRVHPGFAAAVGAAIVFAQAALAKVKRRLARTGGGSTRTPSLPNPSPAEGRGAFRTSGGEPVIVRLKSGKIQV